MPVKLSAPVVGEVLTPKDQWVRDRKEKLAARVLRVRSVMTKDATFGYWKDKDREAGSAEASPKPSPKPSPNKGKAATSPSP